MLVHRARGLCSRHHRSNIGLLLAVLALGLAPSLARADATIDDDLRVAIEHARPGEQIPIVIYLEEQGVPPSSLPLLKPLPFARRRAAVRASLQSLAERTQERLLDHLAELTATGEASEPTSLWMVNAIAVSVVADQIEPLTLFDEARALAWDPPVPVSEMTDDPSPLTPLSGDASPAGDASPSGAVSLPGDASLSTGGGAHLDSPTIPWNVTKVKAPQCWTAGYDGTGVLVGVIDSGVDYTHPDLADHMWINLNEVPGDTLDNDNNGKIDDVRGWDFVDNDNDPMDGDVGHHGTAVAGVVAGDGTSGTQTGIAPGATLLPIRASGGQWSAVFAALDYAVLMNVDVIQMSLSQKWVNTPRPDYAAWRTVTDNELALGYMHANSIGNEGFLEYSEPIPLNIAAPGNSPSPWLSPYQYLAGSRSSVVSVGAITQADQADDFTSRGPSAWFDFASQYPEYTWSMPLQYQDYPYEPGSATLKGLMKPDLCAPGPGTISLDYHTGYRTFSGTSAATPHVSGALAILLQAKPDLTPETADMILETTAFDLGAAGKDPLHGAGRLDCYAALQKLQALATYSDLMGMVRDAATLDSIPGANVTISTFPLAKMTVNSLGSYRWNLHQGLYTVIASAFGYRPDTLAVNVPGDTTIVQDFLLIPIASSTVTGVVRTTLGAPIAGASVKVKGSPLGAQTTGVDGRYTFPTLPVGQSLALEFMKFNHAIVTQNATFVYAPDTLGVDLPDTLDAVLPYGLFDDFEVDQGWTRGVSDTAVGGKWERCDPVATFHASTMVQPEDDASSNGTQCYVTQTCAPGASELISRVLGGMTSLVSPLFDATVYHHPVLNYRRWYSMDTGTIDDDSLRVEISTNAGVSWKLLERIGSSDRNWTLKSFQLDQYVTLTDSMQFRVKAWDVGGPSIVEAGLDEVYITQNTTDVSEDPSASRGLVFALAPSAPNPLRGGEVAKIRFSVPANAPTRLSIFDVQGRRVADLVNGTMRPGSYVATWDGHDQAGRRCAGGLYFYRLNQGEKRDEGRIVLLR